MSISAAMTSAVTGLAANAQASEVIATNISNAQTPGYGLRNLVLGASSTGGGVQIVGVDRSLDLSLLTDQRSAAAAAAGATVTCRFSQRAGGGDRRAGRRGVSGGHIV